MVKAQIVVCEICWSVRFGKGNPRLLPTYSFFRYSIGNHLRSQINLREESCKSIFCASSMRKSEDIKEGLPLCQDTLSVRPNEGKAIDDDHF